MRIDSNLLITYGGVSKIYKRQETVFQEGDHARFYFQILDGAVKMTNLNEDGREFIQGIFKAGESFGEPPLFIGTVYPASATTILDSVIIKLSKETLFKILAVHPELQMEFLRCFAKRVYSKSVTVREIVNSDPEHRIVSFFANLKREMQVNSGSLKIPYTRQEIANFTGLRVETVIRTLSRMHTQKKISIIDRKVYF